jgi:hypothetical protein
MRVGGSYALFHTIKDMMSVILRIDARGCLVYELLALILLAPLSPFPTSSLHCTAENMVARTVWHIGCPTDGCEGLRVLGTWKKPGWGLRITEIGRTGIFSPHKYI